MANQPTIVVANLDDAKLKASIDRMVNDLNAGLNKMTANTDAAVRKMQASLQSLGDVKFNSGGSDGGSSRRTRKQQEETNIVMQTARAYDQLSASMQKTASSSKNESPTQTMQTQLELMIERLRAARSQYSSFIELAAHATTTGDKGLFQFATENVHRYGQEVHDLIPQIRNMRDAISQMGNVLAPQGHAIENFAKSLQRTNPELALLNQQYKRGVALLQQQNSGLKRTAEEERAIAEESRNRLQKEAQYAATSSQREKQRREDITQSAQAARELSRELIRGMSTGNIEINYQNYAKLKEYFEQMRQVYHNFMSEEERESPVGKALKNDINVAGAAIATLNKYASAYNRFQSETPKPSGIGNNQSLDSLRNAIKSLSEAYSRMTVEEMRAGKDTKIIEKFQRLSREAQVLQRRLSTPVSLSSAMKLPEKTLDEIAYKMQMLASYRLNLNIFDPKEKAEIDAVNKALDRLGKEQNKILGNNKEMLASNNALIRSFNYMKNRLAFYFTVGASTQFIKSLIDIRSQYEMNERALGILINSAERGTQIFKELSEMALVSPYTLIELSSAAKQLVAYDIAAKDVVDTTRRLADMAAAVGVPMERLTYALGQIKAYGYLNSRDARMFANAGIPLVKQLSDYYTQLEGKIVSTADVYDRMKKKAIDYNDVMAVVTKMTDEGGKFFDFQAKMAETLKVRLANLTLAWNNMLNEIGENQQGILTSTIGALKELFLHWKDISNVMNTLLVAFGLWKTAQAIGLLYIGELNTAMGAQVLLGQKLGKTLTSAAAATKSFITASGVAATAFLYVIADAFMTWQRNSEEIQKFNSSIADGAKEASEALDKMLHSSEMVDARLNAINGKLSSSDAAKAWERIREQLELSALTSKDLIAQLMLEPDLNKRVAESFNLAERIESATNKLVDLNTQLKVTQDSFLYGLFGEGIAEDINDFTNRLETAAETEKVYIQSTGSIVEDAYIAFKGFFSDMKEKLGDSREEAEREIKNFAVNAADIIKDELGEEGLKDKIQVNEAIARVLRGFEQQFPNIRGKGKALFETMFNDIMAEEFGKSFDKQAYYYNKFLDQLKKDHASAFGDVTDDILKDTHKWSSAQLDAIQKTADRIKKDMPEASQDAINDILSQLNSTEFKIRIVAEMATTTLEDVQKRFKDKFINQPWIADQKEREKSEAAAQQRYGTLMRKNGEDNVAYEKRISDERKKQLEISQKNASIIANNAKKQDEDSKAILADAQAAKNAADQWLNDAKTVESWGGYDFSTKKENTAANKAQHEAETELQKALKEELQLIEKVRSTYKTLTKEGMNHLDAITTATSDYEESVTNVNNVLKRYGLELDLSKFAGIENPHGLVVMLQKQLDTLFGKAKPAEIQALQVKIKDIKVDAAAFDQKTFATGLNDQLGKLKDEYELAIALDADPELGESFASLIGLDLDSLPRTVSEYAKRATNYLNEYMDKNKTGIQLPSVELTNQQLKDLKDMVDTNVLNAEVYERIKKVVNEIREARKKEMEEHIRDWNKLIEKYSEYETKIKNIQNTTAKERRELVRTFGNEAQRATAVQLETQIRAENDPAAKQALIKQLGDLANQVSQGNPVAVKLNAAIGNKDREELAKASFEEFQKTPEWVLATGDLAYMTRDAIGYLIDKINDYKKTAKYLDPKQIKQMNNALKSLYKEQRKNNPFEVLIQAIDQAKENAALFDDKIDDTKNKIKETEKEIAQAQKYGYDTTQLEEQLSVLQKALEELEKAKNNFDKIDPVALTEGFTSLISVAHQVTGAFTDMMNALGGKNGGGDAEAIGQMFTILEKTGSYAAMGAKLGGTYGAIIGGVIGAASSVVSMFAEQFSGNADITDAVKRSERAVKRLELSYIDLKHAMDEAYGTAEIGAQRAIIANKELQLAELKRQLQLEQSRKAKYRDEDRILELRKQIRELEYDIVDSINEITNSLLGISSVGNAAETLVTNMIAAFKKGEQFMDEYKQTFDDMIDNMIMKAIVSNVIGNRLQEMFDRIQQTARERAKKEEEAYASAYKEFESSSKWADKLGEYAEFYNFDPYADKISGDKNKLISREEWDELWKKRLEFLKKQYEAAMTPTPDDVQGVRDDMKNWRDSVKEEFMAYMDAFGIKYGQDSTKQLSALQQGISGVTETTAQAVEAYLNGMSQQAYLRNDLLTQIRDIVVGFDFDIQLGVMSQMLLQLQNSYILMQSMAAMMDNWTVPAGNGIRVELIS